MELLQLPDPRLTLVYRLEATVGEPVELGDIRESATPLHYIVQ